MHSVGLPTAVDRLRAAGEPTRLRLLALCAEGAVSVSDLAQALRQSEPRVSRHLKILCAAGLLTRVREGQWVQYRLTEGEEGANFARVLLAQLDRADSVLVRDRGRARATAAPGARAPGSESRLGRTLAALVAAGSLGPGRGAVLIVGVSHPELLESSDRAGHCTAIAYSRRAAQAARAFAERRGFSCRVLQASGADGLRDADLARAGDSFDAVLLDVSAVAEKLAYLLQQARRVLTAGGRLWIFERYESLESSQERVVEHPLARLRRLLAEAGFSCERLSPVEADGEHVLAAVASVVALPGEGAGAVGAAG